MKETRALADPERLLEEPRRLLEAAVVLVKEAEAVVRRGHPRVVSGAPVGRDRALEILAGRVPVPGAEGDDPENHLGAPDIEVQGRVAEEAIREGRRALRGAIPATFEEEQREAGREAPRLLASDMRAEAAV